MRTKVQIDSHLYVRLRTCFEDTVLRTTISFNGFSLIDVISQCKNMIHGILNGNYPLMERISYNKNKLWEKLNVKKTLSFNKKSFTLCRRLPESMKVKNTTCTYPYDLVPKIYGHVSVDLAWVGWDFSEIIAGFSKNDEKVIIKDVSRLLSRCEQNNFVCDASSAFQKSSF